MLQNKMNLSWWDKTMMAITFAEVGEAGTAKDILNQKEQRPEARNSKEAVNRPEMRV